jgi:hypothetical protein
MNYLLKKNNELFKLKSPLLFMQKSFLWFPRLTIIFYLLTLSLLTLEGLFINLTTNLIFVAVILFFLLTFWKKPRTQGISFIILGIASIFYFSTYENLILFSVLSTPLILIGILFTFFKKKKKLVYVYSPQT